MRLLVNNFNVMKPIQLSILMFILASAYLFPGLARGGGDSVNNGGGLAEKTIILAYSRLERFARLCLNSEQCKLNNHQHGVLSKIVENIPREPDAEHMLIFLSEKKNPGTFIIDGEVKVAKTGNHLGSPIYINTDLLYAKNPVGYYEALSFSEAIAILIHEVGHHYGYPNHTELDLLGVKVGGLLQQNVATTPLLPWNKSIMLTVINDFNEKSFPTVLLNIGDLMYDLSDRVKSKLNCPLIRIPIPILPVPDPTLVSKKPLGSIYHNIHWERSAMASKDNDLAIIGNLGNFCNPQDTFPTVNKNYKLRIVFKVKYSDTLHKLELDSNSVEIKQLHDPWYKIIKFPQGIFDIDLSSKTDSI